MRLLTQARDLARRKARERDGLFVAEGVRCVEELLDSPLEVVGVVCGAQLLEAERGVALRARVERDGLPVADVTERELASAASTESPQGVVAIGRAPVRTLASLSDRTPLRLLVLDGIQDPGNLGTIVRTADALGVDATIALPGTVDLWNPKVVRSAMGSLFRHHALHASVEELAAFVVRENVVVWAAEAGGTPLEHASVMPRLALAVGNEGAGLSSTVRALAHGSVGIGMRPGAESLNVAVATGILLHAMRP